MVARDQLDLWDAQVYDTIQNEKKLPRLNLLAACHIMVMLIREVKILQATVESYHDSYNNLWGVLDAVGTQKGELEEKLKEYNVL